MIAVVDYGLGNVASFLNMYKRMNIPAKSARTVDDLDGIDRFVLPGVGAFDHAMDLLDRSGMRPALDDLALQKKVPVLGVCVGMQMMADGSDEGTCPGLGWVPGRVRSFANEPEAAKLPLPHMGWNDITPDTSSALFDGLQTDARFYFLHSFYFECIGRDNVEAEASYGIEISCAVRSGNVHGVQFHPESIATEHGHDLLANFLDLANVKRTVMV